MQQRTIAIEHFKPPVTLIDDTFFDAAAPHMQPDQIAVFVTLCYALRNKSEVAQDLHSTCGGMSAEQFGAIVEELSRTALYKHFPEPFDSYTEALGAQA